MFENRGKIINQLRHIYNFKFPFLQLYILLHILYSCAANLFQACIDVLPTDYVNNFACTSGIPWTCEDWAKVGSCDEDWANWKDCVPITTGLVKDFCQKSCNNCQGTVNLKYLGYFTIELNIKT